jgi:hypothetical protein
LKRSLIALLALSTLLFVSCAKNSNPDVPTAPTPPQIKVSSAALALAESLDATTTGLIAARDQGKISQADLAIAYHVITVVATTGKDINAVLRSPDDWATQKRTIYQIIVTAGIQGTVKKLPPNAAIILQASLALFNEISAGVGGPTI